MGEHLRDLVHWPDSFAAYGIEVTKSNVRQAYDGEEDENGYEFTGVLRQHAAQWQSSAFEVRIYDEEGFASRWSGWAEIEPGLDPTQIRLHLHFWSHGISRIDVVHHADPLPNDYDRAEVDSDSNDVEDELDYLEVLRTDRPEETLSRRAIASALGQVASAQPSLGPLANAIAGVLDALPSAPARSDSAPHGGSQPDAALEEKWDPDAAVAWYEAGNHGALDCTAAAEGADRAFGDHGWRLTGLRLWWEPGFSPHSHIGMTASLEWIGAGEPRAPWVDAVVYDRAGRLDDVSDVSPWGVFGVPKPIPREVAYSDTISLSLSGAESVPGRVVFTPTQHQPLNYD